jgi:hypothetical protein
MEKGKVQGVLVASVLLALVSLPAVAGAATEGVTFPADRQPAHQCDCETR